MVIKLQNKRYVSKLQFVKAKILYVSQEKILNDFCAAKSIFSLVGHQYQSAFDYKK